VIRKVLSVVALLGGGILLVYSLFSLYQQQNIGKQSEQAVRQVMKETEESEMDSGTVVYKKRPQKGEKVGELVIPRLNAVLPIIEGAKEEELSRGVGHMMETVLPGENDMSVLAGHRDTVFRHVGQLEAGDELVVQTDEGHFLYHIEKTWITDKDDRSVIHSVQEPILLLITCYPFEYIGSAPERYIIQARLNPEIQRRR
jgi:sortase A